MSQVPLDASVDVTQCAALNRREAYVFACAKVERGRSPPEAGEPGLCRRRELHPKSPFRKSIRLIILASTMGAGGYTMASRTRHWPNC